MKRHIVGIDIGGTNFRIGAVDEAGNPAFFRKLPVGDILHSAKPLRDLSDYLQGYLRELEEHCIQAEAVSIGFPATLDRARQTVVQAPNLPFLENLPVVSVLSKTLDLPVFIERDVTLALFYDLARYHIPAQGIICGIYFGTGIGNAICIDGIPLAGKNGAAGELGHIPVDGSDLACGCGNTGCIENLAGGKYLAALCRKIYPGTDIDQLFIKRGSESLLMEFVDRMAIAVATEVNILDPDIVLIGGGVPEMKGFPKDLFLEQIRLRTRKPFPAQGLDVIFTSNADEKCVIGAAYYARATMRSIA